ncbi:MAG: hypothetical protein GY932_12425, partial [Arcobacter sp.]|nr:hypothetical protein [Arcobacter sp.]
SDNKEKKYKTRFYFAATASILFAFLFMSNFIKENSFESQYQNLQTEFITLEEEYNSVSSEKIELIKMNKNITGQKNILELQYVEAVKQFEKNIDKKVKAKLQNAYKIGNEYLTILAEIPTVKLTEDDYLVQ